MPMNSLATMRRTGLWVIVGLLLTACGEESDPVVPRGSTTATAPAPEVEVPPWAHVAPEQIAEAAKHGVPAAFENDLGMRFVLIPAGTFRMGSPQDEEGRSDDETLHEVTISKPFYMSMCEVTNGAYRVFGSERRSRGMEGPAGPLGSARDDDPLPVVEVSWDDASLFAQWLSRRDASRTYRLPTEAEWEYGCRSGTTTPFSWGRTAAAGQASYDVDATYTGGPDLSDRLGTTPVGSFQPNPWGLFDVHGNVLEWCGDWYAPYPDDAVADPEGPSMVHAPSVSSWVRYGEDVKRTWAKAKVQRGGGWSQLPQFCRSAARLRSVPTDRQDYVGFRLISPLSEPGE